LAIVLAALLRGKNGIARFIEAANVWGI